MREVIKGAEKNEQQTKKVAFENFAHVTRECVCGTEVGANRRKMINISNILCTQFGTHESVVGYRHRYHLPLSVLGVHAVQTIVNCVVYFSVDGFRF